MHGAGAMYAVSLGNPYLKKLDLSKRFALYAPMTEKNNSFTPSRNIGKKIAHAIEG